MEYGQLDVSMDVQMRGYMCDVCMYVCMDVYVLMYWCIDVWKEYGQVVVWMDVQVR